MSDISKHLSVLRWDIALCEHCDNDCEPAECTCMNHSPEEVDEAIDHVLRAWPLMAAKARWADAKRARENLAMMHTGYPCQACKISDEHDAVLAQALKDITALEAQALR